MLSTQWATVEGKERYETSGQSRQDPARVYVAAPDICIGTKTIMGCVESTVTMSEGKEFLDQVGFFLYNSPLPIPQSPHGIGCQQTSENYFLPH
jgi:hypothetical protein